MDSPIDIIIPVGGGSKHGDIEVQMALRSIERHATGWRCVYVVGKVPSFLRESDRLKLFRRPEFSGQPKAARISSKIRWVFEELQCTDEIAFWNDDYLVMQPLDVRTIPPWYSTTLAGRCGNPPHSGWYAALNRTREWLEEAGLPAFHYDIHVPIRMERDKFLSINDWWERSAVTGNGVTMKSIYGNHFCDSEKVKLADQKFGGKGWPNRIEQLREKRLVVSYGDGALNAGLSEWMRKEYPEPSPLFEGEPASNGKPSTELPAVVVVLGPFRGGTSCVAGIIHHLGVSMGANLKKPSSLCPKGFFEAIRLGNFCRKSFRETQMIEQNTQFERVAWLRKWANGRRRHGSVIGAKHPTLCLMVPDMIEAWPKTVFVAVHRPVQESIDSLVRRRWNRSVAERVVPMMIERRNEALRSCGRPTLHVDYHEVLDDPGYWVRCIAEFLNISPTEEQIRLATEFVDPKLYRFRSYVDNKVA